MADRMRSRPATPATTVESMTIHAEHANSPTGTEPSDGIDEKLVDLSKDPNETAAPLAVSPFTMVATEGGFGACDVNGVCA